MRDHVAGAVLLAAIWAAPLVGQERLEIVPDEGRIVLGGIEWGLSEEVMAVDQVQRLIYVNDLSDPFAVLALSIEDGSLRGTYGAGEGDGPGELRRPPAAVAVGPDGVMASDGGRVNHWTAAGDLVSTWRPYEMEIPCCAATHFAICSFRGQPAMPTVTGVLLRLPEGEGNPFGERSPAPAAENRDFMRDLISADIACTENVAYVWMGNRLTAHSADGTTTDVRVPVPLEEEIERRSQGSRSREQSVSPPGSGSMIMFGSSPRLSTDGRNRLILSQKPRYGRELVGAVIDAHAGCSSLILDRDDRVLERVFMGVHADSAIVYHRHTRSREVGGRTVEAVEDLAYRITLSPLRHIDGEPRLTRSDR